MIGKINMENYKISLRTIAEDNFIEAFNLKMNLFASEADLQETINFWKHYQRVQ